MPKNGIKKTLKREAIRAALERFQSVDLEKLGAPREEDAIHFENVEEILNIPYMNRDEVPLAMDIFKPIVAEGTEYPVIVTIHGGGLTMGDRKISRPFGRLLASKGYLVFSIEYRLAPRANVCMELDDVCAGLDLVGRRLVDYDVDFNRIFIAAESAGAFLATYAAAMKESKELQEVIGYEPTRVSFKAIGLLSGMLYTNSGILPEQLYGDRYEDENFLQYMNPEHPEIINNLPPAFIVTSKADFLNSYSLQINEALKKAGKPRHMLYYSDDKLQHAFTTLQSDLPEAIDSIDKMLAWFEEQAAAAVNRTKHAKALENKKKKMLAAIKDGKFNDQKIWQYVKERASVEPGRMDAPAIFDCCGTYTYGQMFDQWDKYARVFSGLGITEKNKSRVAIVGSISAEPIFAYYGLNMTGATASMFSYPDLLPGGRWKTMVEKENITDMVITDIMVTPQMWQELKKAKAEFGLKNIILLHTRMGGPCIGYAEMFFNEFNYTALKRIPEVQFMDELIEKYKDEPIQYAKKRGDQIAVICHTSGTSNGTRKPLPYTDKTINIMVSNSKGGIPVNVASSFGAGSSHGSSAGGPPDFVKANSDGKTAERPSGPPKDFGRMVLIPPFDFSSASNINGFVHMSLASGNTIVTTYFGFLHPKFVRCFKYYKVDIVFCSGFMIDQWMELDDLADDTFASLKMMGCGGSYISPTKFKKYITFLRNHGFKGVAIQAYGMSEICAGMFVVPPGCTEEDILGFPRNPEFYRILDAEDGKFHRLDEGEREGVLYGRSESTCENTLDGKAIFEFTNIDGADYICMNDVVHLNPSGSISYVGRSNQFFANNEGVRFDSGLLEKQVAGHPNVNLCAVVPVLDKRIHDTVPVLYVELANKNLNAAEQVKEVLVDVYVNGDRMKDSVLPTQFVIVDSIPINASGKIDVYTVTRSRLMGSAYDIEAVKKDGKLIDINYTKSENLNSYTAGNLPEGMGEDSAFNVFDIFSGTPEILKYYRSMKANSRKRKADMEKIKGILPELKLNIPALPTDARGLPSVADLPEPLQTMANLLFILSAGQEIRNHDYED